MGHGPSLKEESKPFTKGDAFILVLALYLITSLFQFGAGMGDAIDQERPPLFRPTIKPMKRIEVLFPAYRIGLFAGEELWKPLTKPLFGGE